MVIIAEAGATKTAWSAICTDGCVRRVHSPGINAATMGHSEIAEIIRNALNVINPDGECVTEVHYYGAGVLSDELASLFPEGNVECASDMLAAARAVCGRDPGIAAILGTGSNSCYYDGRDIVSNIRSGGFILGDEGSGASLGRMFLSDYIKGLVPQDISDSFAASFEADYATIVHNVYKDEAPSRYLGSFAPWILKHAESSDYLSTMVESNFRSFFERSLIRVQTPVQGLPVGLVGGFAEAAKSWILPLAKQYGINISGIHADISDLLIRYHR